MTTLVLLLVFAAAFVATYLVMAPSGETMVVRSRALAIRRGATGRSSAEGGLVDEEMELPFGQRVLKPMFERLSSGVELFTPSKVQEATRLKLKQAGSPMGASYFLGLKTLISAMSLMMGMLLALPMMKTKPLNGAGLLFIVVMLGWRLPELWLLRLITERRKAIERALPDVLDLLSVSVEAGLGLDGAIQKVGEKFAEPTAGEFRELLKSIRLGTQRSEALRQLAERTALPDMRTFTAAVIQAEQLGVSIARVLRGQAEALRLKRKQRVEEKAMSLPLKLLFPLILFIFPTVFIVVLGPVVIQMMGGLLRR